MNTLEDILHFIWANFSIDHRKTEITQASHRLYIDMFQVCRLIPKDEGKVVLIMKVNEGKLLEDY